MLTVTTWLFCATLFPPGAATDHQHKQPEALITPTIDGAMTRTEWSQAGSVFALGNAQSGIEALFYGWNERELFLALQHDTSATRLIIALWRESATSHARTRIARIQTSGASTHVVDEFEQHWPRKAWRGAHSSNISEYAFTWQALHARPGEALWLQVQTSSGHFPATPLCLIVP